jgi:hypothetical protein
MELKDLLEKLDINGVENLEDFEAKFSEKFIAKSMALEDDEIRGKITGKVTGTVQTLAKRLFGLSGEEITGRKYEEVLDLAASKMNAKISELESMKGGGDAKLEEKYNSLKKQYEDVESLLSKTKQDYESHVASSQEQFKQFKVTSILTDAKQKISSKLKSDMSEAERFYFESKINEKFKIDFDEKENPIVLDKDGRRAQNPKKIGSFLSIDEALELEATNLNLIKNNSGTGAIVTTAKPEPTQEPNGRKIHPAALKHAEMLKTSI